jgi:hypothetical protein
LREEDGDATLAGMGRLVSDRVVEGLVMLECGQLAGVSVGAAERWGLEALSEHGSGPTGWVSQSG